MDPFVAGYWRRHYDIAERLRTQWKTLQPDLDGKLHVIVGTADTFHLDGSARRLKETLDALGENADVRFLEGRNHFDVYQVGDDRGQLLAVDPHMQVARLVVEFGDRLADPASLDGIGDGGADSDSLA